MKREKGIRNRTVEILSDKEMVKRIKGAKKEIKEGKTISLKELRKKIEHV